MSEPSYYYQRSFSYVTYSIWVTIAIAFTYQIVGSILYFILENESYDSSLLIITGISQILLILVPTILFARSTPMELKEIFRLKRKPKLIEYGLAILGLIAVNMVASGVSDLQRLLVPDSLMNIYDELIKSVDEMYKKMLAFDGFGWIFLSILFGALVPGITEEFLTRGFLQRSLEEKLRPIYAILISAFLFSMMHLNPIDFIPLMLIGAYLGLLAYVTKSILVPILIHFLNNAVAIIVMGSIEYDESPLGRGDWSDLVSIASIILGTLILYGLIKTLINAASKDTISQE